MSSSLRRTQGDCGRCFRNEKGRWLSRKDSTLPDIRRILSASFPAKTCTMRYNMSWGSKKKSPRCCVRPIDFPGNWVYHLNCRPVTGASQGRAPRIRSDRRPDPGLNQTGNERVGGTQRCRHTMDSANGTTPTPPSERISPPAALTARGRTSSFAGFETACARHARSDWGTEAPGRTRRGAGQALRPRK